MECHRFTGVFLGEIDVEASGGWEEWVLMLTAAMCCMGSWVVAEDQAADQGSQIFVQSLRVEVCNNCVRCTCH